MLGLCPAYAFQDGLIGRDLGGGFEFAGPDVEAVDIVVRHLGIGTEDVILRHAQRRYIHRRLRQPDTNLLLKKLQIPQDNPPPNGRSNTKLAFSIKANNPIFMHNGPLPILMLLGHKLALPRPWALADHQVTPRGIDEIFEAFQYVSEKFCLSEGLREA